MRILTALLVCVFTLVSRAAEERNHLFNCSVILPETTGWQPLPAQNIPSMTVLWAMQHPQRQSVFAVNVLHNLPGKGRDDANIGAIEALLKGMGYQTIGRSTVMVGGRSWLQIPVQGRNNGQPVSGIIRYLFTDDHVFGISMLIGGGKEASQDTEMQAAAASFRVIPPTADSPPSIAGAAPTAPGTPPTAPTAPAPPPEPPESTEPQMIAGVPATYIHAGLIGLGVLIVIVILAKIIGGGDDEEPPAKPPQRKL